MQTSVPKLILDQLQQTYSTSTGAPVHATDSSRLSAMTLLFTTLRDLLPTASLKHIARTLVEATRQALSMDLCALLLAGTDDSHLTMQAASPDLNGRLLAVPPLHIEATLREKLQAATDTLPDLSVDEREQLNPLKNVQHESLLIVPLVAGAECAGLLYCYSSKPRDLDQDEQLILQTIGSFAAMSIINRRLLDAGESTISIKSFFDDLLCSDTELEDSLRGRAAALGCDCSQPHVMLMLEVSRVADEDRSAEAREQRRATYRHALKLVEQSIREQYPHSLFNAREHCLYALVALAEDGSTENLK